MRGTILLALLAAATCIEAVGEADIYRGRYIWGAEEESFQACGQRPVYWAHADKAMSESLLSFYRATVSTPYQAIYIEFRGQRLGKAKVGFAADFDGQIRIRELIKTSATVPTDCSLPK